MSASVVLLGDSLSVGAFKRLHELVPEAEKVARVGASIGWMESQLSEVIAREPRLVLFMGGVNDLAGASPETVFKRQKNLAGLLRDAGVPEVAVSTLPPQSPEDGEGTQRVRTVNQLLRAWRPPAGIRVVDVGSALSVEDVASDTMGIHPGPDGYEKLGEAWAKVARGEPLASDSASPTSSTSPPFALMALAAVALFAFRK